MADGATIAIDHTDLDHPYGTEEGLDYFPSWDGSRHVASMGDTATTIFLLTPGSREGFPVSCRLHETRLTPTQRTVQALERVGEMKRRTGKQVMCVMDRGMDALEIYHAAMRCDVPIVVRARHKRDLVCGSPLPLEEALKRHPFRRTPLRKGELLPRFAIPKKCPPPDQRFDT